MTKQELRTKYKLLRNNLSFSEINELSLEIANQVLKLDIWSYSYYHIFLPINEQKEINTNYLLSILQGKDKNIVLPKTNFKKHTLSNFLLTDSTLIKKNSYNIPEPVEGITIEENLLEVVFVPLLAFDVFGNRVGYGKGFYDLFLKKCTSSVIKIGLSLFEAEKQITNVLPHDIKLNYCITPKNIYSF